ncbi:GNAT family N-acetyltransferase [Sediminicoccus sp. KRV36]|uniref:GNAT family N-acetyltransferase n=1 Tax=Sediminicoccus sp. KRV36 TaxID=3133721 RepID=UPI002010A633|nr:GNAT family N-acetyltransferase [Sediminicoccus rosea]UPY37161.1 GNAT family N-acetyltransferase [Sediminicoccus rosea]
MIRLAQPGDLPALLDLYQHLNSDDPRLTEAAAATPWSSLMGSDLISVVVAEAEGALVGSCMLVVIPNITRGARSFALIENVVTHAAHRKRGLGRAVLAAALEIAWAADCYKVMLATGSARESTLRFYEGAGFRRATKTHFEARRA